MHLHTENYESYGLPPFSLLVAHLLVPTERFLDCLASGVLKQSRLENVPHRKRKPSADIRMDAYVIYGD